MNAPVTILSRGTLTLCAGIIGISLAMTAAARIAQLPPAASPAAFRAANHVAPARTRLLRFADRRDGAVLITDAASGARAGLVPAGAETGFVRGVMRGLARERRAQGVGAAPPFRLTLYRDGELSLTDTATGQAIDLDGFGATNRAQFAALLA